MSDEEADRRRRAFRAFADWCTRYEVSTPCGSYVVCRYLVEMINDCRPLDEIAAAADAIKAVYAKRGAPLDHRPIDAVLAMAEAQLAPGRSIN